jgi:hypothetical protein
MTSHNVYRVRWALLKLMLVCLVSLLLQVSSLDLVTADSIGLNMLLVCSGSEDACSSWVAAGRQLQQQGWPLKVLHILPHGSTLPQPGPSSSAASSSSSSVDSAVKQQQQHLVAVDVDGMWGMLQKGADSAALLVRPDGHVAWRHVQQQRSLMAGSTNAAAELLHMLQHVLHLAPCSDAL